MKVLTVALAYSMLTQGKAPSIPHGLKPERHETLGIQTVLSQNLLLAVAAVTTGEPERTQRWGRQDRIAYH